MSKRSEKRAAKKAAKAEKKKNEFSKTLLIQESVLIWIVTITALVLAFICVFRCFGDLPWVTVMVGLPWTAYGVSQAFYYKKAEKENTKNGIKYETIMNDLKQIQNVQINDDTPPITDDSNDESSSIAVG